MSLAVFTDSTTAQASPAFTVRPASGSSTKTTSVNSLCAWSVMPTVAVSPLTRTHSCDLAYLRSEGMLLINCAAHFTTKTPRHQEEFFEFDCSVESVARNRRTAPTLQKKGEAFAPPS